LKTSVGDGESIHRISSDTDLDFGGFGDSKMMAKL
jgi:hypothetical protein